MKLKSNRLKRITVGLWICVPVLWSSGQESDESIWNLDPFVVSTSSVGYQSRNSLSATKFDIDVRSVPITVTSLTGDYLEDTYSQTIEDAVRFSAGVTRAAQVSGEEGDSFFIRGLKTGRTKRNGIVQLYTQDLTNVERVEVIKGPMSLLYGQVEPGGLINYLTLNALSEPSTSIKLIGGSDEHLRAQINHTGPILKGAEDGKGRLLYRVDASYKREDGWRDKTQDERTFTSLLLEYKPLAGTTIEIQWDRLNQNGPNAAPLPKYNRAWKEIFDAMVEESRAGTLFLSGYGEAIPLASLNIFGRGDPGWGRAPSRDLIQVTPTAGIPQLTLVPPTIGDEAQVEAASRLYDAYAAHFGMSYNPVPINAFNDMDMDILQFELRQQLFGTWFAKLFIVSNEIQRESLGGGPFGRGINGWRQQNDSYSANNFNRFNDDMTYQLEVTGKWSLGPVENETIMGGEYAVRKFQAFLAQPSDFRSNFVHSFVYDQLSTPDNPYIFSFENVGLLDTIFEATAPDGKTFLERNRQRNEFRAAFISNVARLMNARLLILSGLRYDETETDLTMQGVNSVSVEDAVSPQIAASFDINDMWTVYASYSESFVPQVGQGRRLLSEEAQQQLVDEANASGRTLVPSDFTEEYAFLPWLGDGHEFGAKFELFGGKLSGSFAFFRVNLEQISQTSSTQVNLVNLGYDGRPQDVFFPQVDLPNNKRKVNGFETELFARPFEGFQAVISYAYLEAGETLDLGFRTFESPAITVPSHQVSVWTKYDFTDGPLEGLYIGGGFTWMDERYGDFILNVQNPSENVRNGRVSVETDIVLDAQITFDLLLGYKFAAWDIDYDIQLNIKNLLDERFMLPGGMPNSPLQAFLSLQMQF